MTRASFSPFPYTNAYQLAEKFLAGGRAKTFRPVGNNTVLHRVGHGRGDIALRLHRTDVVTYHADGTMTIYGGGWNTVTTKQRISAYSPARPGSDGKGNWVVGYTDQITPAKVQKCRKCTETGPEWVTDIVCDPARYYWGYAGQQHPTMCKGGTESYAVEYVVSTDTDGKHVSNWDEHFASRYIAPCEHGESEKHQYAPCEHGVYGRHITGVEPQTCYQCKGTGRFDYGSKRIPILVTAGDEFRVDATGKVLATEHHPISGELLPVMEIIRDLFDQHSWSRETIAGWVAQRRSVPA